jgi:hypothetical protein
MRGPLHVIRRRRSEQSQARPEPAPVAEASPTAILPTAAPTPEADAAAAVPAGVDPADPRPSFANRGRLRRRLRYLRRVRELGLRDVGGLVFDQHRFGPSDPELVQGKLAALSAVDAELRGLERALDERRAMTELREPGLAACPRCGALHGSDARFCPSCGVPLRGPRAVAGIGEAISEGVGEIGPLSVAGSPTPARPDPVQAVPQPTEAMPAIPQPPGAAGDDRTTVGPPERDGA